LAKKVGDTFARRTLEARAARDSVAPLLDVMPDKADVIVSEKAQLKANEIGIIRTRLAASATGKFSRAAEKLVTARNRPLSDADYKTFSESVSHAVRLRGIDRELAELERDYQAQVTVRDVDPYAAGSPFSFFADRLSTSGDASGITERVSLGAEERLARHGRIVARALDRRTKYGQAIESAYVEQYRSQDVHRNRDVAKKQLQQYRSLTTGGGTTASAAGGGVASFVTPALLLAEFVEYRSPAAGLLYQLDDSIALPDFGLTAYIPQITGATTVQTDTEGSTLTETDPTMGLIPGPIVQKVAQLTLSQGVIDRVGPGITGDQLACRMLKSQLDAAADTNAITQILANAQAVTNSGTTFALTNGATAGVGGFYGDIHHAKNALSTTAGVRLRATACFAQDTFVDWLGAYSDGQGRPVFSPNYDPQHVPIKTAGDGNAESFSGYVLNGLALFADSNIGLSGSAIQVLVFRPDTVHQLSGPSVCELLPQYQANNLEPIVRLRQYVTTIPRHPTGIAVISSSAGFYAASQFA
jgi:hypothetical protein